MKACRIAAIAAFLFLAFTAPLASQQPQVQSIDAWSKMPSDSAITFMNLYPGTPYCWDDWINFPKDNGITKIAPEGFFAGSNYFAPNETSTLSPYNQTIMANNYIFDFAPPAYAVGATFLSLQDANFHSGVQTVSAYDEFGNLIGTAKSSSLTETNGAYETHYDVVGRAFVSSWAGIWSDTPIHQVTFTEDRVDDSSYSSANFGAFAFSRTPLIMADTDGDGVPNDADQCPSSILNPTVVIGSCDSGVPNDLFSTGCTISDLIDQSASSATNHGNFVSAVASLTNELMNNVVISGSQQGKIQRCAAKAVIL